MFPLAGDDKSRRFELRSQALASALGAAVGLPFGPAGGVVGAAVGPFFVPAAEQILTEIGLDGRRRSGELIAAGCDASGLDPEEFLRRILSDEKLRLLAGTAIAAATRTAWEDKLPTLGRSLASGVLAADEAAIDTEQLIESAVAEMEAPHLCLLELLICWYPSPGGGEPEPSRDVSDPTARPPGEFWHAGLRVWTTREIENARPRLRPVLLSLLGMLQRHGLAVQEADTGTLGPLANRRGPAQPTWTPTELGALVYQRFLQAGASVPQGWLQP